MAAIAAVVVTAPEASRYPVPQNAARERLATAPLPEPLLDITGHQVSLVREDGALVWHLGDAERRSTGRVTLKGDGASTEVMIQFALADNALGDSPISRTRLTRSIAGSIFAEHVDAVLGERSFDARRMMTVTSREIHANPEMLREYGEAVDDQFDEVVTMLNGDIDAEDLPALQSMMAAQRAAQTNIAQADGQSLGNEE